MNRVLRSLTILFVVTGVIASFGFSGAFSGFLDTVKISGTSIVAGDWVGPVISIKLPNYNIYTLQPLSVTVEVEDQTSQISNLQVLLKSPDGAENAVYNQQPNTTTNTTQIIIDPVLLNQVGEYQLHVLAEDAAGNATNSERSFSVRAAMQDLSTPILHDIGEVINQTTTQVSWSAVDQANFYRVEHASNPDFIDLKLTEVVENNWNLKELVDGEYWYRVFACNQNACSNSSQVSSFVADATAPSISVSAPDLGTELIQNGSFDQDLKDWNAVGPVFTTTQDFGLSTDGKVAQIGSIQNNEVDVATLSQNIQLQDSALLSFDVAVLTQEILEGFDQPAVMVFADDKMLYQGWVDQTALQQLSDTWMSAGWQQVTVPIEVNSDQPVDVTIAFYAGNTHDNQRPSVALLDNVTTASLVSNQSAQIQVEVADQNLESVSYSIEGTEFGGATSAQFTLPENIQPGEYTLTVVARDTVANQQSHSYKVTILESEINTISDLSAIPDIDSKFSLTWTAPENIAAYEWRLADPQADVASLIASWDDLAQPIIVSNDGLPGGGLRAPRPAGEQEIYQILQPDEALLAIRTKGISGQLSDPSTVLLQPTPPQSENDVNMAHQIIINEVMWAGSSSSTADEWIELYNTSSAPVNISNWLLKNAGTSSNPDLSIPSDTIIQPNAYYLVANYSAEDSALIADANWVTSGLSLNNAGEQLTLLDTSNQVIDQTPLNWTSGGLLDEAYFSMERKNYPGIGIALNGSSSDSWAICNSQACSDVQAQYWDVSGNFGTPGGYNLSQTSSSEPLHTPQLLLDLDQNTLSLLLDSINEFDSLEYSVLYTHQVDGYSVQELVQGSANISEDQLQVDDIYLGTCSSTQESCVPHQQPTNIQVTVVLNKTAEYSLQLREQL